MSYKTGVLWRAPIRCPKCGKTAYYSSVGGYRNVQSGGRGFCPHCGHAW